MCVEALVTAEGIINEVQKLKSGSISLFRQERFKLDKRHFNVTSNPCNTTKLNFAKQQLRPKAKKQNYQEYFGKNKVIHLS